VTKTNYSAVHEQVKWHMCVTREWLAWSS